MNRPFYLFAGIIGSFALSCYALVLVPQTQIGNLEPQFGDDEGKIVDIYPIDNYGAVKAGRTVYASEGCVYCHSQQVRDAQNGADIARGWGTRRTVARDYIFENPPLLGNTRLGPDLSNVGAAGWRDESKDEDSHFKPAKRDAAWQLLHLYAPRSIMKDSGMPPYRYLFEKRKISGQRSDEALNLTGEDAPEPGWEVVPKPAAKALVSYLLSLDRSHPLNEVKSAAPAPAAK
jgi:cytochrome c oxidase cbb3-type subunit 2